MRVIDKALEMYREYYCEPNASWDDLTGFEQKIWFDKARQWAKNCGLKVHIW